MVPESSCENNNTFLDSFMTFGTGGFPLRRLYIQDNTISAFFHGLFIVPDAAVHDVKFRLDDSVITSNRFLPSYYFDPGNVEQLAACMKRLQENPDLAVQLGKAGRARYEQEYSPAAGYRRMLENYRRLGLSVPDQG